ncbi:MAG: APC family permease [Dehalococcoidia bacterium]
MQEDSRQPEVRRGRLPGDVFVRRPPLPRRGLHRVLGVPGLFSTAYGDVGSSIYYVLGVTAMFALGLTPLAFVVAGLLFGTLALTYAEGTTAMPEAGGASSFARRSFNDVVSFIAGWALALNYVVTMAISAFSIPNYLAVFWSPLGNWPGNSVFGIGVIAFLAGINVAGVRESSRVNMGLAALDLLTQALVVMLAIIFVLNIRTIVDNVHFGEAPEWNRLMVGMAIAMIAFTGIETVSNLSEETRNPAKNVPRAVLTVFVAVIIMYTLIPLVAVSAMPVFFDAEQGKYTTELVEEFRDDPVLGIVGHLPSAIEGLLSVWVGILAGTILLIATNAGMLGMSRLAYSLGRHGQLPPIVSRIHAKRRTPAIAIVLFSLFAALLIVPGRLDVLAGVYSFGAMLAFSFAHLSIIVLRIREPDMQRPFKIPFNLRVRGVQIPVTAVIGLMGTALAWAVVVFNQPFSRYIGIAWMVVGLSAYLTYQWWRRRRRSGEAAAVGGVP